MGFVELFTSANSETGGLYGATIPFLIIAIVYSALSAYGFNRAFSSATFIGFVSALPLYAFGIVPDYIMVIVIMLTLVAVFFLMRSEGSGGRGG